MVIDNINTNNNYEKTHYYSFNGYRNGLYAFFCTGTGSIETTGQRAKKADNKQRELNETRYKQDKKQDKMDKKNSKMHKKQRKLNKEQRSIDRQTETK